MDKFLVDRISTGKINAGIENWKFTRRLLYKGQKVEAQITNEHTSHARKEISFQGARSIFSNAIK
jgi:hypothetical protein